MDAKDKAKKAAEKVKAKKPPQIERAMNEATDELRRSIERSAAGNDPVLVGPFTGEVGFELLYWIPLVRWAVREFPQLDGRLVYISRGGVQHWLGDLNAQYVDLFTLYTPEEYLARGASKAREIGPADLEVLERVRNRLGISKANLLHPSVLYELYYKAMRIDRHAFVRPLRNDGADTANGLAAIFEPIMPPALGVLEDVLPPEFVAVRFYFRPSFPDTPDARRFAASVVTSIAKSTPVVLLNNRLELDDHADFDEVGGDRIVEIHELMTPETNLHVQTIALSRAKLFVGTYGGLAYLGPHLGVPSLSFSTHPDANRPWHLDLAQRAFAAANWPPVVSVQPQDLALTEVVTRNYPFAESPLPVSGSALSALSDG